MNNTHSLEPLTSFFSGEPFNVEIGSPHKLSILRNASRGQAGNQPFAIQPKIAIVDAGGNVVVEDLSTLVTAEMTPSISHSSYIIVDTTNDPSPSIESVSFSANIISDDRILYGPGDIIEILVKFTQEVALYPQSDSSNTLPRLVLNVMNDESVYAELSAIPQEGLLSDTLLFHYVVSLGDYQTELDYASSVALQTSDYSIEDAFGRSAVLTLPDIGSGASLSASKTIAVSDSSPSIISIDAEIIPEGVNEIGAGHVVDFLLSFDREVSEICIWNGSLRQE